jgi:bacterioferritin-associated ferredoxin
MTRTSSCPEFSLLSQFLDGDLAKSEANQLSQHVASCPQCRTQIRHLEQAQEFERAALSAVRNPITHTPSLAQCLAPETLFAYAQGLLSTVEERTVESHVSACGVCLNEVKEVMRATATLTTVTLESVPAELEARIESQWVIKSPLPRIVIQVAREGLRLIEKYLTPPLLDVREILAPLPAYRSRSALGLRLDAGETEITVVAAREQGGVVVKLTLTGAEQQALGGRRIFLRQRGRAVFSEQTNDEGVLIMPFLAPGHYEVACHEIHTTFLLELRP